MDSPLDDDEHNVRFPTRQCVFFLVIIMGPGSQSGFTCNHLCNKKERNKIKQNIGSSFKKKKSILFMHSSRTVLLNYFESGQLKGIC